MNIQANNNVHVPKLIAQSVHPLATGWTSWGPNPGGGEISAPTQTGPGAHPASCTVRTRSFLGVHGSGRSVDHPPPSSAEVQERVQLHVYSPSGSSWPTLGRILPFCMPTLTEKDAISLVQTYQRFKTTHCLPHTYAVSHLVRLYFIYQYQP
jgi:hypothetical protein